MNKKEIKKNEYKNALYFIYGASLLALLLSIIGISDGLIHDFIVYLIFAIILHIFKNKKPAVMIVLVLFVLQLILLIISILARTSGLIEFFIGAITFSSIFKYYKSIKKSNIVEINQ